MIHCSAFDRNTTTFCVNKTWKKENMKMEGLHANTFLIINEGNTLLIQKIL